jgi:hypothetical protein
MPEVKQRKRKECPLPIAAFYHPRLQAKVSLLPKIVPLQAKARKEKSDRWKFLPSAFTYIYTLPAQNVPTGI